LSPPPSATYFVESAFRYRVTWVQIVGGLWNIYVSYMANLDKAASDDEN
jgi:hypothetical protein